MTEATEDPTGGGKTPGETAAGIEEPEADGGKIPVIPAGKAPGTAEEAGGVKGGKLDPAGGKFAICRSVKKSVSILQKKTKLTSSNFVLCHFYYLIQQRLPKMKHFETCCVGLFQLFCL